MLFWSNSQNAYRTCLINSSDSITPKFVSVSHLLLKFWTCSSQTCWRTTFPVAPETIAQTIVQTLTLSSRPFTLPTHHLSLALCAAPFSQSSICSLLPHLWSFTGNLPIQPYMSSAVSSSSATAATGLEAKLTSAMVTVNIKYLLWRADCSSGSWEVPVEVLSKSNNHQQRMYTACSNLHRQTDKNL